MPYLLETTHHPDDALRERLRNQHLAYLDSRLGVILAAGAKLSDDGQRPLGSAYILDVDSRAEAEAFLAAEPYMRGGLVAEVRCARWRRGYFDHRRQPVTQESGR